MGRKSVLVLLVLLLGAAAPAYANGYGNAKELIDKAEAEFSAGRDAEALELLKEALRVQTTLGRGKKEYGYAAYVHFRRAKYYASRGNKKKAKSEIKRALAVRASQEFVDPEYLVSRTDPLVAELLPQATALPTVALKQGRVVPNSIAMIERGKQVYVLGNSAVQRLDRKKRRLTTLHRQPGDSLYRMDARVDGSGLLIAYERPRHIVYLKESGSPPLRVPRSFLPSRMFLEAGRESAILYPGRGATAYRVELTTEGTKTLLFEPPKAEKEDRTAAELERYLGRSGPWRVPLRGAEHVVFGHIHGLRVTDTLEGSVQYSAFYFNDAATVPLVETTFRLHEERQTVVFTSRDDRYIGFYLPADGTAGRRLVSCDLGKRTCTSTEIQLGAGLPVHSVPELFYSHTGGTVVALWVSPEAMRVERYSPGDTAVRFSETYNPGSALGRGVNLKANGAGVLADNQTIWTQLGAHLFLVDAGGKMTATQVARMVRKGRVEWDARAYTFADPDEFYFGIARGGGRYYHRIGLEELRAKAKVVPNVRSAKSAPLPRLGGKSCDELERMLAWPFEDDTAHVAHTRAVVERLLAKCNLADSSVELVKHVLRLPWNITDEHKDHQKFLFETMKNGRRTMTLLGIQLHYLDGYKDPALAMANFARYLWWDGQRGGVSDHPMTACSIGGAMLQALAKYSYEEEQEWAVEGVAGMWAGKCLELEHGNKAYICARALETRISEAEDFFDDGLGKKLACGLRKHCRAALGISCSQPSTVCRKLTRLDTISCP